jgi:hypothetical protein
MVQHVPLSEITPEAFLTLPRGEASALPDVRSELERVVNALPTQVHPEGRTAFLTALLDDLRPGGVWTHWPEDSECRSEAATADMSAPPAFIGVMTTNSQFSHWHSRQSRC